MAHRRVLCIRPLARDLDTGGDARCRAYVFDDAGKSTQALR